MKKKLPTAQIKVSTLFIDKTFPWGLRGDPYLWRELKQHFSDVNMPNNSQELSLLIETAIEQILNTSLNQQTPIRVEKFRHGGMSSGLISPQFWKETAIPLLIERFNNLSKLK